MLITLPRKSLKYLDDKIVQIEIDKDLLQKGLNYTAIKNAKGILKNHSIDGLEYQKKIRKEWDRTID